MSTETKTDGAPAMTAHVQMTERMAGFVALGAADYETGFRDGQTARTALALALTITIDDVVRFTTAPTHEARARGLVICDELGGRLAIEDGVFEYAIDVEDPAQRCMSYRLDFRDPNGRLLRLIGQKEVEDDPGLDLWRDTTTLFVRIETVPTDSGLEPEPVAAGILRLRVRDFGALVGSMLRNALRRAPVARRRRVGALLRYGLFFFGKLWGVYRPRSRRSIRRITLRSPRRQIALQTLEGVTGATVSTHYLTTEDKLGLSMLRFNRAPCDDVVLLVHGLTSSSDMFFMPEHANIVQHLLDQGFTDVWCLDNRMSNRHPYNLQRHRYSMDDVALFDYPPAVAEIRDHVGDRRLHVICHCLGSATFAMSLFGKAVDGIASVVSNSVALTPRVPWWSRMKLAVAPFLVEYVLSLPYINPRWSDDPGFTRGEILSRVVSLFHRECDVPACHMLSLMWGAGWPALYEHRNLHEVTHARVRDLFGATSVHYYRHVRAMVRAKHTAVKLVPGHQRYARLPDQYFEHAKEITTPWLFMTGDRNRVFTNSNVLCYDRLKDLLKDVAPRRHELAILAGYGHQDVFMGKDAARDVFPRIIDFLRRHGRDSNDGDAEEARKIA